MIAPAQKNKASPKKDGFGKEETKAVFVIIALIVLILLALFMTFKRPEGPGHSPAESPIVKQRIINLQKSR